MNDRIAESADRLGLPPEAVTAAYEAQDAALAGPWEAHSGEDYTVVMLPGEVTDTASIRISGEHAEALASRIAAVPDLLAAIKLILKNDQQYGFLTADERQPLLDAEAKAEGRS